MDIIQAGDISKTGGDRAHDSRIDAYPTYQKEYQF